MPDLIRRRGLLRTPGADPIGGVPPIDRGLSAWRGTCITVIVQCRRELGGVVGTLSCVLVVRAEEDGWKARGKPAVGD
jgi:hypothetical protein